MKKYIYPQTTLSQLKVNKKTPLPKCFFFPDLATAGANSTTNAYVSAAADGKSRTLLLYKLSAK